MYRANNLANIAEAQWFVSLPPPLGVLHIRLDRLINVGEKGFYLSNVITKYGCGYTTCRIRYPSHYTGSEIMVNVIIAIEAGIKNVQPLVDISVMLLRCWLFILQNNCDQYICGDFIESILNSIENAPIPGGADDKWCIMWGNLSLHKTAYVKNKILGRPTHNRFISVDHPHTNQLWHRLSLFLCTGR